jgi:hypothetical protein
MPPSTRDANKHAKARRLRRLHARERLERDRLQAQQDCALLADLEARAGDRSLSGAERGCVRRLPGLTPQGVLGVVLYLTHDLQWRRDPLYSRKDLEVVQGVQVKLCSILIWHILLQMGNGEQLVGTNPLVDRWLGWTSSAALR